MDIELVNKNYITIDSPIKMGLLPYCSKKNRCGLIV
jgi:hypothetical protein